MRTVLIILATLVIAALLGWTYAMTGWYNIAASEEHTGVVRGILHETMENSVRHHAKSINVPATLANPTPEILSTGFRHFDGMCVTCHGAPGVARSEIGAGLNPEPPSLAFAREEWSPRELFWITKYGVKMAGMPAFGKTHTDEEIWAIVAFMWRLYELNPDDYLARRGSPGKPDKPSPAETEDEHEGHHH